MLHEKKNSVSYKNTRTEMAAFQSEAGSQWATKGGLKSESAR